MKTTIFAQLGNAVISMFAWFVKLNPMWAYRFTKGIKYYEFFLTGAEKEIKVLEKLLKKDVSKEEIRKYTWSKETQTYALEHTNFADIFINNIWCEELFDAAMRNPNQNIRILACTQRRYTPTAEQIQKILSGEFNKNTEALMELLVKNHHYAFSPKVLNAMDNKIQICWFYYAELLPFTNSDQVAWALAHTDIPNSGLFIKRHFMHIPINVESANNLKAFSPELFEQWVNKQTSNTLCKCCLKNWVKEKDELHLRIIEQKTLLEDDAESALQLITSTSRFYFSDAVNVVLGNNAATTCMLDYVKQDARKYTELVEQLLNKSNAIAILSKEKVAKLSKEHHDLYWKKMAEFGHITAQQYAELPKGDLKEEITQIMEDNALISWFQKNKEINERSLSKFGNRELSERVQHWLAENSYLAWLVYYFSGSQIFETTKIAFGWDWKLQKNDTKHHLSTAVFKKLVDDDRARVIRAYLHVYKNILPEKREYLLCSPLKHLAIGVGTR